MAETVLPGQIVDINISLRNLGTSATSFTVAAWIFPAGGPYNAHNRVGRFRALDGSLEAESNTIPAGSIGTVPMWIAPWWDGQETHSEQYFDIQVFANGESRIFYNQLYHPKTS